MTTRSLTLTAALAAAGIAAAVLAPGSSGQAPAETISFELLHREARVTMIDEAPKMRGKRPTESPGDRVVTRAPIRDASGRRIGRMHSTFLVTGGRSPRTTELMTGTIVLSDGQLDTQGVFDNARDSQVDTMPITGGSGRYAGARGEVVITSGRQEVGFEVRLLP